LNHFELYFSDIIFELNLGKLVPTIFLGRRRMTSFSRWWEKGKYIE
jgi:hypothetical protein